MALNWYLTLRNLANTDVTAAELFNLLQKAETDEEKECAKQKAKEYILQTNENKPTEEKRTESIVLEKAETVDNDTVPMVNSVDSISRDETVIQDEEKIKTDLSQPAFNPRLAKCGITREEELFLKNTFVRKLTHEEKILMRRRIYEKKTKRNQMIQAEYRAKRIADREKDLHDPEKIAYHRERKLVFAIVDALTNHKNMIYIFSAIDGLTPEIMKDLLKKPEIKNAINQANNKFIENFHKKYGE
jgi:hypothetical protein